MLKKLVIILITVPLILFSILNYGFPGYLYKTIVSMERSLAGFTKKSVTVDNHTITYLEGGKGESVLLIHGFNADKDNWTRFARYLTKKYHVVALDNPGFGESSKLIKESYTYQKQAERINRFTDIIGMKKFHIAGNSMGGAISAMVAANYPDKVLSLGLFNAAGVNSPIKSAFQKLLKKGENPLVVKKPEDFIKLYSFVFYNKPLATDSIKKYLGSVNMKNAVMNEKIFKDIHGAAPALDQLLNKINTRTLILWGDKDRILDVSSVPVFKKNIKNSTAVIIKNCGHLPMLEEPKTTAKHYLKFISNTK